MQAKDGAYVFDIFSPPASFIRDHQKSTDYRSVALLCLIITVDFVDMYHKGARRRKDKTSKKRPSLGGTLQQARKESKTLMERMYS
jgi:hypothetical protein